MSAPVHPALAGLPDAVLALLPELAALELPDETLADCARCAMLPAAGAPPAPWHFHPDTRCCTYHPELAAHLVGRALRRGGPGAEAVRRRIAAGAGLTPHALLAPPGWREAYEAVVEHAFGREPALRCPYWVAGELSCGIWADRNAVCRTWFCRSVGGWGAQRVWSAVRALLARVEMDLAAFCVRLGHPPAEGDPIAAWEAWYRWCADAVDHIRLDAAAGLESARVTALRAELREITAGTRAEALPDVLIASVRDVRRLPEGRLALTGYSAFDALEVPADVFEWLGRLDGIRPWREALAAAQDAGAAVDEALVRALHRIRAVRAPVDGDEPGVGGPPGAAGPGAQR